MPFTSYVFFIINHFHPFFNNIYSENYYFTNICSAFSKTSPAYSEGSFLDLFFFKLVLHVKKVHIFFVVWTDAYDFKAIRNSTQDTDFISQAYKLPCVFVSWFFVPWGDFFNAKFMIYIIHLVLF